MRSRRCKDYINNFAHLLITPLQRKRENYYLKFPTPKRSDWNCCQAFIPFIENSKRLHDEAIRYHGDAYGCFRDHFCVSRGKNRCYLGRQQIFIPKSTIFSSSSPTLFFSPFYVHSPSLFPISKNGRYLGGTWEEHGRNVFVSPSLVFAFQSCQNPILLLPFLFIR